MTRSTSVVLEDTHDTFIQERIASGRSKSASEVVREALERLAKEEAEETAWRAVLTRSMSSHRAKPGTFDRIFEKHGIRNE